MSKSLSDAGMHTILAAAKDVSVQEIGEGIAAMRILFNAAALVPFAERVKVRELGESLATALDEGRDAMLSGDFSAADKAFIQARDALGGLNREAKPGSLGAMITGEFARAVEKWRRTMEGSVNHIAHADETILKLHERSPSPLKA